MRRFFALSLTLALATSLIACSSNDSAAESAPDTASASVTAAPRTAIPGAGQGDATVEPGRLGVPSGGVYTAAAPDFEALTGATAHTGSIGAAVYRIEMPDDWNGDLLLYAHGYRGESTQLTVGNPPRAFREYLIGQGYAWAASSYSENGYVPGIGADDTLALKQAFEAEFGEPERTYLYGESMGGAVIALSLENFADAYDGALAVCGAMGGQEEIDYLAAWALLAEYLTGVSLPLGEAARNISPTTLLTLSSALGSPEEPTEKGEQFVSGIRMITGGPRPFFLEGMAEQYVANFAYLLVDPTRQLPVTKAATNADIIYAIEDGLGLDSAALNASVRRLAADPAIRDVSRYPDRAPTTGKISDPLLTLHGTGDLFVPISQQIAYLAKAKAAGTDGNLVQRAIRAAGHCDFSAEELRAAWDDLVAWVEGGEKPAGDDLSGDLTDIGKTFTNPLREGDPGTR